MFPYFPTLGLNSCICNCVCPNPTYAQQRLPEKLLLAASVKSVVSTSSPVSLRGKPLATTNPLSCVVKKKFARDIMTTLPIFVTVILPLYVSAAGIFVTMICSSFEPTQSLHSPFTKKREYIILVATDNATIAFSLDDHVITDKTQ